ncbi:hypothetical protein AB0A89_34960, partial [Streptomyces albogriseolus]
MTAVKEVARRPIGHFAERSIAGLVAVTGAGVAFGLLLLLVRVRWSPLQDADHSVAEWFNSLVAPHHPLVTVLQAVTDLGGRPI